MKILHDVHNHNIFSNCCNDPSASTAAFVAKEVELGNKIFGLSNHIWDESVKGASYWYSRQTITKAEEAKASLANAPKELKCLFGAESEYYHCFDRLGMSLEGAKRFDYMLIPHSHQHMRNEVLWDLPEIQEMRAKIAEDIKAALPYLAEDTVKVMANALKEAHLKKYITEQKTDLGKYMTDAAVKSFNDLCANETFIKMCATLPTSIAHPFAFCGIPNEIKNSFLIQIPDEVLYDCFTRAKAIGAYCEINCAAVTEHGMDLEQNQLMRVFRNAKKAGCQFTFGTDSHSVKALELIRVGDQVSEYLGLTKADIAEYLREGVEE